MVENGWGVRRTTSPGRAGRVALAKATRARKKIADFASIARGILEIIKVTDRKKALGLRMSEDETKVRVPAPLDETWRWVGVFIAPRYTIQRFVVVTGSPVLCKPVVHHRVGGPLMVAGT